MYSESDKSLNTRVSGDKELLNDIEQIWARSILECELGKKPADSIVYELDTLRSRDFQFITKPEDGVSEVRIKKMKIKVVGTNQRITLEVSARKDSKEIYGLLEQVITSLNVSEDLLKVVNVRFQLIFPGSGNRREENLSFNVSHPNSCSLRCEPKHEIAKDLLKRWGLDVSGSSQDDPDEPGEPA